MVSDWTPPRNRCSRLDLPPLTRARLLRAKHRRYFHALRSEVPLDLEVRSGTQPCRGTAGGYFPYADSPLPAVRRTRRIFLGRRLRGIGVRIQQAAGDGGSVRLAARCFIAGSARRRPGGLHRVEVFSAAEIPARALDRAN